MEILKINRLEAHDRLLQYNQQADYISQGCSECIKKRPTEFGNHPFYVYAHTRTDDDGYTKRLIWMPRLSKPKPQTNSMLFRVVPPDLEKISIVWMLPIRELWGQYAPDKMTHDPIIYESIDLFRNKRDYLARNEDGDVSEEQAANIYRGIARSAPKPKSASSPSLLKSLHQGSFPSSA